MLLPSFSSLTTINNLFTFAILKNSQNDHLYTAAAKKGRLSKTLFSRKNDVHSWCCWWRQVAWKLSYDFILVDTRVKINEICGEMEVIVWACCSSTADG